MRSLHSALPVRCLWVLDRALVITASVPLMVESSKEWCYQSKYGQDST
jgi:hypothetical protein